MLSRQSGVHSIPLLIALITLPISVHACSWILWTKGPPSYLPGEHIGARTLDWSIAKVFPDQETCAAHASHTLQISKPSDGVSQVYKVLCTPDTVDPRRTYKRRS